MSSLCGGAARPPCPVLVGHDICSAVPTMPYPDVWFLFPYGQHNTPYPVLVGNNICGWGVRRPAPGSLELDSWSIPVTSVPKSNIVSTAIFAVGRVIMPVCDFRQWSLGPSQSLPRRDPLLSPRRFAPWVESSFVIPFNSITRVYAGELAPWLIPVVSTP